MTRPLTITAVSLAVLALAQALAYVPGNLVETCYKTTSLLAPALGGLVLTALYMPSTRPVVAWAACAACVGVCVWINYFSGLTFLLAAPAGLSVQLATAYLFRKDTHP